MSFVMNLEKGSEFKMNLEKGKLEKNSNGSWMGCE